MDNLFWSEEHLKDWLSNHRAYKRLNHQPIGKFLESLKVPSEKYKLVGNVLYLYAPDGIGRSKLVEKMGKAFSKVAMTARNLNTINKLLEMIER